MGEDTVGAVAIEPTMVHLAPTEPHGLLRELLGGDRWAMGVAEAIAQSPAWQDPGDATIVVNADASAHLAVIGRFDPAMLARLEALAWQVTHLLPRLHYVTYLQAEQLAERLAERLTDRFGLEQVRAMSFGAVPRGGHIVLGMLAYALGVAQERLERPPASGQPLVLVDDIVISGNRLKRWLTGNPQRDRVVVATLFATAELGRAMESDPRVLACVAAEVLTDLAPLQEADHAAWQHRWAKRAGASRYFVGRPEPVAFAWSEPDVVIWNAETQREELPWRLLPPELSLKHRRGGRPGLRIEVQELPPIGTGLRPAPSVMFGTFEGVTLVSSPASDAPLRLAGSAQAIWNGLLQMGDVDSAARAVAERYEVDVAAVSDDVASLATALLDMGILVKAKPEPTPGEADG